jgi:hypothetical protein
MKGFEGENKEMSWRYLAGTVVVRNKRERRGRCYFEREG